MNLNVNWSEEAFGKAKSLFDTLCCSRKQLLELMDVSGFSQSEISYALKK